MTDTPPDLSISEFRSLIAKAARGLGLPWGHAEEAGWAAEWLARRGLPAADWLCLWLQRAPETGCALTFGLALAEGAALPPDADMVAPGLVLPFAQRLAQRECRAITLSAPMAFATVTPDGCATLHGPVPDLAPRLNLSIGPVADHAAPDLGHRPHPGTAQLALFDALALRTTVPPSARSRADAGSSRGDND